MNKIIEKAYAKINLALEVMNSENNYHLVNNLMILIDIYDELEFEIDKDVFIIDDKIDDNIILKAAKLFINEFNIKSGVKIKLNKKIPQAAGLAGGSTDAAATLRGLNKLFNVNASDDKLRDLAKKLGSDVPFFIGCNLAMCTHYGEVIEKLDINFKEFNLLLLKPKFGLSTKEVYKNYIYDNISKSNKIKNILESLNKNDIEMLKENIFNDLERPAFMISNELFNIYNDIKKISNIYLIDSGPTLYIINPKEEVINYIKETYNDCFIYNTKTIKIY